MPQFPEAAPKRPPSRRGTPSTDGPIPYFGTPDGLDSGENDFFSSIGTHRHPPLASSSQPNTENTTTSQHQWGSQQMYQSQVLQYELGRTSAYDAVSQPQQFAHNQADMYGTFAPKDIPPRSATGPAMGYPHSINGDAPTYTHYAQNIDPYRSASVIYNNHYGHQTTVGTQVFSNSTQDGAAFFNQLSDEQYNSASQNVQQPSDGAYPQHAPTQFDRSYHEAFQGNSTLEAYNTQEQIQNFSSISPAQASNLAYYNQYSVPEDAIEAHNIAGPGYQDTTAVNDNQSSELTFDETVGQYFDPQSGQYYNNETGTWYYPQAVGHSSIQGQTQIQQVETLMPITEVAITSTSEIRQQNTNNATDTIQDGPGFFDNLGNIAMDVTEKEPEGGLKTHSTTDINAKSLIFNQANSELPSLLSSQLHSEDGNTHQHSDHASTAETNNNVPSNMSKEPTHTNEASTVLGTNTGIEDNILPESISTLIFDDPSQLTSLAINNVNTLPTETLTSDALDTTQKVTQEPVNETTESTRRNIGKPDLSTTEMPVGNINVLDTFAQNSSEIVNEPAVVNSIDVSHSAALSQLSSIHPSTDGQNSGICDKEINEHISLNNSDTIPAMKRVSSTDIPGPQNDRTDPALSAEAQGTESYTKTSSNLSDSANINTIEPASLTQSPKIPVSQNEGTQSHYHSDFNDQTFTADDMPYNTAPQFPISPGIDTQRQCDDSLSYYNSDQCAVDKLNYPNMSVSAEDTTDTEAVLGDGPSTYNSTPTNYNTQLLHRQEHHYYGDGYQVSESQTQAQAYDYNSCAQSDSTFDNTQLRFDDVNPQSHYSQTNQPLPSDQQDVSLYRQDLMNYQHTIQASQHYFDTGLDVQGSSNFATSSETPATVSALSDSISARLSADNTINPVQHNTAISLSAPPPTVPPQPSIFDLQSNSERTSTELSYQGQDIDHSVPQTINDTLGRLNTSCPVVSFGFGGKIITMFPRKVQRYSMYASDGESKIAPGMVQIQQLSDHLAPEQRSQSITSHFCAPLITGDTTLAALLKRRNIAVSYARSWLNRITEDCHETQEVRALWSIIIMILDSFTEDGNIKYDIAKMVKVIVSLSNSPTIQSKIANGFNTSSKTVADTGMISHGNTDQLAMVEDLLLSGKRKECVAYATEHGLWAHALIIASCTDKDSWRSVIKTYTNHVLDANMFPLGVQYRLFSGIGQKALEPSCDDDNNNEINNDTDASNSKFITAADINSIDAQEGQFSNSAIDSDPADALVENWSKTLALMLANRTAGDQAAMIELGDKLKDSGFLIPAHICYILTLQSKDIFLANSNSDRPRVVLLGISEITHKLLSNNASFSTQESRVSHYYRSHIAICMTEAYELAVALHIASKQKLYNNTASSGTSGNAGGSTNSGGGDYTANTSTSNSSSNSNDNSNSSNSNISKGSLLYCLPHLQAYKLYYAWWLIDCGEMALASRYCDCVLNTLASLPRGIAVPFINVSLVRELRNLRNRLDGFGMSSTKALEIVGDELSSGGANAKSWLSRAMPRPSFTSLMSAFDTSLDKFVTGADGHRISLESNGKGESVAGKYEVGPDRQVAPSSGMLLPSPPRALGAASFYSRTPSPHINTTSSVPQSTGVATPTLVHEADEYPSAGSANNGTPSFISSGYIRENNTAPNIPSNRASLDLQQNTANLGYDIRSPEHPTHFPQQAQHPYDTSNLPQAQWEDPGDIANIQADSEGFITPGLGLAGAAIAELPLKNAKYDSTNSQTHSDTLYNQTASNHSNVGDEDEDIFGFSKKKPKSASTRGNESRFSADAVRSNVSMEQTRTDNSHIGSRASVDNAVGANRENSQDEENTNGSGSGVFGILKSLWGSRKNQANLGENSNFVYDPVAKRWVDKNSPSSQQDLAPPPPPPSKMNFQSHSSATPPYSGTNAMGIGSVSCISMSTPPVSQKGISPGIPMSIGRESLPPMGSTGPMPPLLGRPQSTAPLPSSSVISRTGTPSSLADSSGMPMSSTSGVVGSARAGKRRGARSKYVDLLNQ